MINSKIKIFFKTSKDGIKPKKNFSTDAGWDLFSNDQEYIIQPGQVTLIHTGVFLEIPKDYYFMLCSRSGLSLKNKVFILNSPGIIDQDYRGEICGILANFDMKSSFILKPYSRFAQLILHKHLSLELIEKSNLSDHTDRGTKGFGSSDQTLI